MHSAFILGTLYFSLAWHLVIMGGWSWSLGWVSGDDHFYEEDGSITEVDWSDLQCATYPRNENMVNQIRCV